MNDLIKKGDTRHTIVVRPRGGGIRKVGNIFGVHHPDELEIPKVSKNKRGQDRTGDAETRLDESSKPKHLPPRGPVGPILTPEVPDRPAAARPAPGPSALVETPIEKPRKRRSWLGIAALNRLLSRRR